MAILASSLPSSRYDCVPPQTPVAFSPYNNYNECNGQQSYPDTIMTYIIMRRGPDPGKVFPLAAGQVTIGRGSKNDIIIHDNEVSRNHMRLVETIGGYELHDLNSSNGTFVNGQKVDGVWQLQSQCIIELGDSITLEFRLGPVEHDPELEADAQSPQATHIKEQSYMVVIIESQQEATVYPLEGMSITIGRSTANDIVIVEPELSREHFRLTLMPQGYFVEDLGSTNGTFVNGEALNGQRPLYTNDIIQIGTTVRFRLTNAPESLIDHISTSSLGKQAKDDTSKRKSPQADVPGFINPSPEPTEVGTGVDHKSLEGEVLISYARDDWEAIVAPMVDNLYEIGIKSWVDQYLVERSNDWVLATEQARLECWLLIVVVSPEAMKSDLVRKNWRHFQNREKPIILIIHRPVDRMPIGASRLTTVQYNPAVPEVAFQQLLHEIERLSTHVGRGDVKKLTKEIDATKLKSTTLAALVEDDELDVDTDHSRPIQAEKPPTHSPDDVETRLRVERPLRKRKDTEED